MAAKFESKNIILTKKLNNVIYEIMVKTNSDMVYVNDEETLTEKLSDITELLTEFKGAYDELKEAFEDVVKDANESFNSFKEVWDYVNINGDPKSELIKLIESKQASEEGKGLSTHDFSDIMYEKLKNGYSREELDDKFKIILEDNKAIAERIDSIEKRPNILISESADDSAIPDYSCWYQIISKDNQI